MRNQEAGHVEPCRNFCILGHALFTDPRDGRSKYVLSNFVAGGTGSLIIIDQETNEGQDIPLPGDAGAWAVLNWRNEHLLVGTCPTKGYLHCLDLRTREWAEPLRHPDELYIWCLTVGSDGMVYGGTWPGCALLRYDPGRHTLENLGRVSPFMENRYCRQVFGAVAGFILVQCGAVKNHLAAWDISAGRARSFAKPDAEVADITKDYICTRAGSAFDFYDPSTLAPVDGVRFRAAPRPAWHIFTSGLAAKEPVDDVEPGDDAVLPAKLRIPVNILNPFRLADGGFIGTRGQEWYRLPAAGAEPLWMRIPVDAPPTAILTIASDPQGKVWGSCGFGQTMFSYDPPTGKYENLPQVCDSGGEVYGIAHAGGRIFMSAYSHADHIVYDPARPWDQYNNRNPRTLPSAHPDFCRPSGKSVIGPDGAFWTGWMAKYGVYGGGLSRVDPRTLEVRSWYDPVAPQAVASLASDDRYLYFTTNGSANGRDEKFEAFHLVVWDPAGRVNRTVTFEKGETPGPVAAARGRVAVAVGSRILVFDPDDASPRGRVELGGNCSCLIALTHGRLASFNGAVLSVVDPADCAVVSTYEIPGPVGTACLTPDEVLWFASGSRLYRMPGVGTASAARHSR